MILLRLSREIVPRYNDGIAIRSMLVGSQFSPEDGDRGALTVVFVHGRAAIRFSVLSRHRPMSSESFAAYHSFQRIPPGSEHTHLYPLW
jgi:hypothetical protein